MVETSTVLAILAMAMVTYLTRILGYVGLRNRTLSARSLAMMEAAPGCVLISVIAPYFVSGRISDLLALAVTIAAATRLPMLPTVVIGMAAASAFRLVMG